MERKVVAGMLAALAMVLLVAGSASANVRVGSSGWEWGNPLPQGNTINDIAFSGTQGYAVGAFGTILSTADGGTTWTGLSSGTFTDLSEVQAISATSLFAGGGCVARRSDDGGKTFTRVKFTPVETSCPQPLAAAWFVSPQTGYIVVADGTVLRTDNNGDSFAQKTAIPGTGATGGGVKVNDIRFTDANIGFAATSDGKIFRTADGANSWTVVNDTQRQVRQFLMFDATKGIAIGDGSLYLATSDGGLTWVPKALGGIPSQNLHHVTCAASTTCVMASGSNQIVRTIDSGDTATLVAPSQDPVSGVGFASATRLVALGGTGSTAVSDDAGATFTPIGGRLSGTYGAMIAGPTGVAFAPGSNGSLAKTVDGGKTWTRGNVSTSETVIDVSFPTSNDGYALDQSGGLFKTADGGATWTALDTGSTARPQSVEALSPSIVIVGGPRGLRRSTDGGDSFSAVKGAINNSQISDLDAAKGAVFADGFQDLYRSTDKGKTWTVVRKPGTYKKNRNGKKVNTKPIQDVDFVTGKTGYFLDRNGFLYRTVDGGSKWSTLTGVATNRGYGIAFSDANKGYVVIDRFGSQPGNGYLLRTSDGGKTWAPEFVVASRIANAGVAAGTGGTDYLLGGTSSLLNTTSGGLAGTPSKLSIKTKTTKFKKVPKGNITVTGTLKPTLGRTDQVTVSSLAQGSTLWRSQTVPVSSNGSFTTSWRLAKGTTTFVAQWSGNFQSAGRGTTPLTVKVGK